MAGSSNSFHEPYEVLPEDVRDRHRAIVSLMEELEAVDWYDQRISATSDPELRDILEHNRDEEKEHAAMVLEWLRRHDAGWAAELSERLFQSGAIVQEDDGEHNVAKRVEPPAGDGSLGIGSLKEGSR
jgi:uncharacterized protein